MRSPMGLALAQPPPAGDGGSVAVVEDATRRRVVTKGLVEFFPVRHLEGRQNICVFSEFERKTRLVA